MAEKAPPTSANHEKAIQKTETGNTATSQALPFAPHTALSSKVVEALHADPRIGLSESDAKRRIEVHGPNRLKPPKRPSVWGIMVRQIGNAMTLVLSESRRQTGAMSVSELTAVAAMAVSLGTFDYISGGVIAALVILNVSVGTYTEWQAEKVSHCV
jgi:magnesium-transporting ATPase (P-type)